MNDEQATRIEALVERLYNGDNAPRLPFHDYDHIVFVTRWAVNFGQQNGADLPTVKVAALLHDLNYIADPTSDVDAGKDSRRAVLLEAGISDREIDNLEGIIRSADVRNSESCSGLEAQALSDADMLYKILPVTPVLFSHRLLVESNSNIRDLAIKILEEQLPRFESGSLFYNPKANDRYHKWAATNFALWRDIIECVEEPTISALLATKSLK